MTADNTTERRPHRCGMVTLAGQPNAGKSTLLNQLLGEKLAIVSPKPQTTRDQIRGVLTTPDRQFVFIDTPGVHRARSPLNRAMVGVAIEALESVDVVVLVVDATKVWRNIQKVGNKPLPHEDEVDGRVMPGDRRIYRQTRQYNGKLMIALNKVDAIKKRHLLPIMQAYATLPEIGPIVPISARDGDGMEPLLEAIADYLPEAPRAFEPDMLTDRSVRFLAAELIREQVFWRTHQEVPYGVAVEIEVFDESDAITHIQALIHVERNSQRGILIGKGGAMIKEIGTAARKEIEHMLQSRVRLELQVRVELNWSERVTSLRRFGYGQR